MMPLCLLLRSNSRSFCALKTVLKSGAERLQTNAAINSVIAVGLIFRKLTPPVEKLDHTSGNFITGLNVIGRLRRRVSGKNIAAVAAAVQILFHRSKFKLKVGNGGPSGPTEKIRFHAWLNIPDLSRDQLWALRCHRDSVCD